MERFVSTLLKRIGIPALGYVMFSL